MVSREASRTTNVIFVLLHHLLFFGSCGVLVLNGTLVAAATNVIPVVGMYFFTGRGRRGRFDRHTCAKTCKGWEEVTKKVIWTSGCPHQISEMSFCSLIIIPSCSTSRDNGHKLLKKKTYIFPLSTRYVVLRR